MVAMMLVTSVYSIVDGLFISNFAGNTAFAAMNLVWPAIALIAALGLMIGTGGSALVSKTFGEGDQLKANAIFTMLIRLCIISGIAITIVFFILMKPIAIALGAEGGLIEPAVTYGRIVVISMPAFILQMAFQSFFMTAEKPQLGTMMSIISGCLNIVLDALFVAGFGWGLTGAAIATSISLTIGGLFPVWYFASHRNNSQLKFLNASGNQSYGVEWMHSHTPADWHHIGRSCTNGMSEFIGNIALNIVSICYNLQLMRFIGENGVSAYGIIMYAGFIFASIFIGYNICVTQVIAYNYGAGNKAEMRSLLHKSLIIVLLVGMAMTALSEILAPTLAHIFMQELARIRKEGRQMPYLRPDAKSQITIEYDDNGKPLRVEAVVISTQHDDFDEEAKMLARIRQDVEEILLPRVLARLSDANRALFAKKDYKLFVNPTGKFVIGGPHGDTGLTGRKIIVDTYGGRGAHGGGAFSGKDASKVDRSAAYATRHIAKNMVAAGICDEVLVQVAYAIGVAQPVGLYVNTYGTAHVALSDGEIAKRIGQIFDMRPYAIIQRFGLKNPIFAPTAAYGHIGRDPYSVPVTLIDAQGHETTKTVDFFGWERLDYVDAIKQAFFE